jgi:phage/plasmid-associated DNA primase
MTEQELKPILTEQEMNDLIKIEPHKWFSNSYGGNDYKVKIDGQEQTRYFHRPSYREYVQIVTKEEKNNRGDGKTTDKNNDGFRKEPKGFNSLAYRYGRFSPLNGLTPAQIAQVFIDDLKPAKEEDNYFLYDYYLHSHTKYKLNNHSPFATIAQYYFDNKYPTSHLNNLCVELRHKLNELRRQVKYNYDYLQFGKSLLNLDTFILQESSRKIHTPLFFNFKLDIDADISEVEAYAKTVFPKDYLTVQEFLGTTLDPRMHTKKILLASGIRDSGRTHFFSTIKEIYDKNATVKKLRKLCDDTQRFNLRWLNGSLFNYSDDVSKIDSKMHDMFKHLIGGLFLDVEVKGGDEFEISNITKYILSMNGYFKLNELDDGVLNKLLYVDSPNKISSEDIKRFNIETFAKTDTAKSAVINWLIAGCKRYREQNGFTPTSKQDEYMEKTKRSAQTARDYFDDLLEISPEKAIIRECLRIDYRDYCKKYGGKMLTNSEIDDILYSLFPTVENKRVSIKESTGSRQPFVYKGIAYRDVDGIGRTNYIKSGKSSNGGESYKPDTFLAI